MDIKKKLFIGIEAIIYFSFIFLDLYGRNSIYLKYLGIIICFVYALINKKFYISIALFFTVIADYFLLVIDSHYILGVISFIFVQIVYFLYLKKNNCDLFIKIRILIIIIIVLVSLLFKIDILYCLTLCYFSVLVINCISSYTNKNLRIFSIGLTLFILCDISVGLFNILPSGTLYTIVSFLMWIFYLPSQVLISLSKDTSKL